MTGSQPLTNCRCLAFVDFSATRKTTKLAGTKDMATIMKMAITTSVPWSLQVQKQGEELVQFQFTVFGPQQSFQSTFDRNIHKVMQNSLKLKLYINLYSKGGIALSVSVLFSGLFVAPPHLLSEAVTIMFSTITQSVTHISAPRITLKQINDAIAYKFPVYAFATLCYSHFIRDFF